MLLCLRAAKSEAEIKLALDQASRYRGLPAINTGAVVEDNIDL